MSREDGVVAAELPDPIGSVSQCAGAFRSWTADQRWEWSAAVAELSTVEYVAPAVRTEFDHLLLTVADRAGMDWVGFRRFRPGYVRM